MQNTTPHIFSDHREKRLFSGILVAVIFLFCVPVFAHAEDTSVRPGKKQPPTTFCTSIDKVSAKISADILLQETRYANKEAERAQKLAAHIGERDRGRIDARFIWDSAHDSVFAKLKGRAKNPTEAAAIEKFKTQVDHAVYARRASVDNTFAEFNADLDRAIHERQTAIDTATTTFRDARERALSDAKGDCLTGVAPSDVRTHYVSALKSAKNSFQESIKNVLKRDNTLPPLIQKRAKALAAAEDAFKVALDAARQELKASFSGA